MEKNQGLKGLGKDWTGICDEFKKEQRDENYWKKEFKNDGGWIIAED